MEVDLPRLAQRVALDEMSFVVHVKAMFDRVVFEIGDEAGYVDDCHSVVERTERAPQCGPDLPHRFDARVERTRATEEPVDHAVIAPGLDRDTGGAEPLGVRLTFVTERVVLTGDDDRRSETTKVGRA